MKEITEINLDESFEYWKEKVGDLSAYPHSEHIEVRDSLYFHGTNPVDGWVQYIKGGFCRRFREGSISYDPYAPNIIGYDVLSRPKYFSWRTDVGHHREDGPAYFQPGVEEFWYFGIHLPVSKWLDCVNLTHEHKVMIKLRWG